MDGDWLGLAASAAGGGVFGVIGTTLGRIAGYFETRQQNDFEKQRWQHELDVHRLDLERAQQSAEAEFRTAQAKGGWEGLKASYAADAALTGSFPIVNAIRALTRPVLTLLLWLITSVVFFNVDAELKGRIVETAVFAATAATLWWFGDRTSPVWRNSASVRSV